MKSIFEENAAHIIEVAKNEGIENVESVIKHTLEHFYQEGLSKGIDDAWPWVLVNENDGTEKPFGTYGEVPTDMAEDDVMEQFKEEFETELNSLIETYLDLSEYASYEEFEKAYDDDKVEIEPIITGLYDNLYLHNRYTGYDSHYDEDFGDNVTSIMDYICNEWDNLK